MNLEGSSLDDGVAGGPVQWLVGQPADLAVVLEQRVEGQGNLPRRRRVILPGTACVLFGEELVNGRVHVIGHVGRQDYQRSAGRIVGRDVSLVRPEGAVVADAEHVAEDLVPRGGGVGPGPRRASRGRAG